MRRVLIAVALLSLVIARPWAVPRAGTGRTAPLPARLTDQEFWRLSTDSSEPGGYFRSENITNLTSNELLFQYVIPELVAGTKTGGVYLGVGPEQNYTYMAAVRPALAVIFDIRRGNLDLQLMYKAIFELSRDRADFVAMLFGRPRPQGLDANAPADDLFAAIGRVPASEPLCDANLRTIEAHLTKTHGLPLPAADVEAIGEIYRTFCWGGFAVRPSPSYDELMTATDQRGVSRSYLATEDRYQFLKDLEARNLVVPVVGDFGGPKAIRAVGRYLRQYDTTVSAFYLSNVEQYLVQDGKWDAFCRNVTTLPLDGMSTFIRSESGRGGGFFFGAGRGGFVSSLGAIQPEVRQGCG